MLQSNVPKEIVDFRPVYLRPTRLSDEAITVALLIRGRERIDLVKTDHPVALINLKTFCGDHLARQVIFALKELNECLLSVKNMTLDEISAPNDLLSIGKSECFYAEDVKTESIALLRSLSSLYASDFRKNGGERRSISHKDALIRVQQEAGRLNVIASTNIFRGIDVRLSDDNHMRFSIASDSLIGEVVSFVTPRILQAKLFSEASVARLCFAHRRMKLRPTLYALTPLASEVINADLLDDAIGELRLITEEYGVLLRQDKSVLELAHEILKDAA